MKVTSLLPTYHKKCPKYIFCPKKLFIKKKICIFATEMCNSNLK